MVTTFTHFQCEQLQVECAGDTVTLMDIVKDKQLRRPIGISMVIMTASITTGIVAIFTYSTSIFIQTGLGSSTADPSEEKCGKNCQAGQIASIILSVFNTVGALVANGLVDRVGRRKLLLVGIPSLEQLFFVIRLHSL